MTIEIDGTAAFRLRTHSIPDMPGRPISIKTTSGFSPGISASAASPSA